MHVSYGFVSVLFLFCFLFFFLILRMNVKFSNSLNKHKLPRNEF